MDSREARRREFDSLDAERLIRMRDAGEAESVYLEFKRECPPGAATARKLAKAASAFANADGGIILWGVSERGEGESRDSGSLRAIVGLDDAEGSMRWLNDRALNATSPAAEITNRVVEVDGRAIVKTLVLPTDGGPIMAVADDHTYYRRNGASSDPMDEYAVREAYLRVGRARLTVSATMPGWDQPSGSFPQLKRSFFVILRNGGRHMAKFPMLYIRTGGDSNIGVLGGKNNQQVFEVHRSLEDKNWTLYSAGSRFAIPPLGEHTVDRFCLLDESHLIGRIDYKVCAEGSALESGALELDGENGWVPADDEADW